VELGPFPTGRAELEARLVRRASADPTFKAELLTQPRAALERELGFPLPERFEIVVVEERPDRLCLVLPVDLSGLGGDAVWAMTGERPQPRASHEASQKRVERAQPQTTG
jgi:hypothetical protein